MSRENIEVVQRLLQLLNSGDIDGVLELCEPVFHLDMSERVFNPEIYEGHDGMRRFYADVREIWEDYRWIPEEFVDARPQVVALVRAQGRGRGSGLEIDRHIALVWTLAHGRATSLRLYADPREALDAVGRPE